MDLNAVVTLLSYTNVVSGAQIIPAMYGVLISPRVG